MSMPTLDDKIAETMDGEAREMMDNYGKELGLFGLIAESFRGKLKFLVMMVFLLVLVFAVLLVYCAVYFFTTETLEMKLNWMAGGLTALFIIGLLRLWYLMELNRLSVIREVKRLELQIALLRRKSERGIPVPDECRRAAKIPDFPDKSYPSD
jgi:hypothetical protein